MRVDVNVDSLIIELTGTQSKIEAFIGLLQDYEILEIARTETWYAAEDTCIVIHQKLKYSILHKDTLP